MKTKRKAILWTGGGVLLLSLCVLPFFAGDSRTTLNVSGDELLRILAGQAITYPGPPRLPFNQAIKDPAYLKKRAQLFFGRKLMPLVTTNASIYDLAIAFAFDSDSVAVIVPKEPEKTIVPRLGTFDSSNYARRSGAARAIRQTIEGAGWRIEYLSDGKVAFLYKDAHELVLAAKSPIRQRELRQQFDQAMEPADRKTPGRILSHLWRVSYLDEQTKQDIARDHYHLILRQLPYDGSPSWEVRTEQSFPFPEVYTEFTPTLYCNEQIKWSPDRYQYGGLMNEAGRPRGEGSPITSMSGGEFKNGDVLQYRIDLAQKVDGRTWQTRLWTKKIVLQGLRR